MKKYPEYKTLDLPAVADRILKTWENEKTFEQSIELRKDEKPFVFY